MIIIDVLDSFSELVADQLLLAAAEMTLHTGWEGESPSLTIRITDQQEIRDLNRRFRQVDKSTDVLSFEGDFRDPDLDSLYLGDVVISFPQAKSQAENRGHEVDIELQLLVVHGILHLLGYDHVSEPEKKAMWSLQERILHDLDLDIEVGVE